MSCRKIIFISGIVSMNLKMLCGKGFKSLRKFIRGVQKFEYDQESGVLKNNGSQLNKQSVVLNEQKL